MRCSFVKYFFQPSKRNFVSPHGQVTVYPLCVVFQSLIFKPPVYHPVVNVDSGELDVKRNFPKWRWVKEKLLKLSLYLIIILPLNQWTRHDVLVDNLEFFACSVGKILIICFKCCCMLEEYFTKLIWRIHLILKLPSCKCCTLHSLIKHSHTQIHLMSLGNWLTNSVNHVALARAKSWTVSQGHNNNYYYVLERKFTILKFVFT